MTKDIKVIETVMIYVSLLIVVVLLSITALEKLIHFAIFRVQLKMSPWSAVSNNSILFAWVVPSLELLVSLLLLCGHTRRWGFLGAFILFTGFSVYMLRIWIGKVRVSCGCNAFIEKLSVAQHVVFDLSLLLISVLGFLLMKSKSSKI